MVTLRPMGTASCPQLSPCHVTSLALSEYGNIVVFCKQESNRALCRYSINGKLLSKDVKLKEDVADVLISGEYLVTGGTNGKLEIRQLHRFEICLLICLFVYLFVLHARLVQSSWELWLGLHEHTWLMRPFACPCHADKS